MGKSSFAGYDSAFPSPSAKSKPAKDVNFSVDDAPRPGNPLKGAGELGDGRPHIDDNQLGKNKWPMGEGKVIDGDKARHSQSIGKGPKGK